MAMIPNFRVCQPGKPLTESQKPKGPGVPPQASLPANQCLTPLEQNQQILDNRQAQETVSAMQREVQRLQEENKRRLEHALRGVSRLF